MLALIFWLVVIGVALYLINTYVPMAQPIKTILNVVVVLLVVLWIATLLGLDVPIPRVPHRP